MFTKFTKDIAYIQKLSDLPNDGDGLSAEELKRKFDSAGEDLKQAFNNLIDEMALTNASKNIGVGKISTDDTSESNIEAKLKYLHESLVNMALGAIPDNSITKAKMNADYESTLAKNNGELQTNLNAEMINGNKVDSIGIRNGILQTSLNAEMLGGESLAQVLEHKNYVFNSYAGSYNQNQGESDTNIRTQIIDLGFTPSLVMIFAKTNSATSSDSSVTDTYVVFNGFTNSDCQIIENGFSVRDEKLNNRGLLYAYIALK